MKSIPMTVMKMDQLKNWEKNPRTITRERYQSLKQRIQDLGIYKNLIVDQEGTVIGGNMRFRALKELGAEEVWVAQVECRNDRERLIYALSDNEEMGENDRDKLAELSLPFADELILKDFQVNLGKSTPIGELLDKYRPTQEEEKPEVEFTEELFEAQNYIVLYFNNEIDWLNLQSIYPLKTVKALDSKEGFEKMGIGRVVDGIDFLKKVRE